MSRTPTYQMKFRRRREEKTDYAKRLELLKSRKHRLVIRKSNNNVLCQLIQYEKNGDKTIASVHSDELRKFGWKLHNGNIPAAYLSGYLLGLKAKEKKLKDAVLDIGRQTPVHGSVIFSALKGAVDAGMSIPFDEKAVPSINRIKAEEMQKYASSLSEEEFKKKFPAYAKSGVKGKIAENFDETLKAINKKFTRA